jgi:serine/threonine protein kinase
MRSAAFKRFGGLRRLHSDRSGHASVEHVRHHLYVGRDKRTRADALIKVTNKPGLVYEQNLVNEIATLRSINQQLPDSPYFPLLWDHGRLADGRIFLIMSLFDEWPLAMTIGPEPIPDRLVGNLRAVMEVGTALAGLHQIGIVHVDLNPMNILYRVEAGRPVIRIVDFESSYERSRHSTDAVYNPPTTHGFTAPELPAQVPDARADVFSLGAVLYTLVRGYGWTWGADLSPRIAADVAIDQELRRVLLKAVHPDPDGRYQSMLEMHGAVAAYLESIWPGRTWR